MNRFSNPFHSLFLRSFSLPQTAWGNRIKTQIRHLFERYHSSLRFQLVCWNVVAITLFLAALGVICHFVTYRYMLQSVDNELSHRVGMFQRLGGPHPRGEQPPRRPIGFGWPGFGDDPHPPRHQDSRQEDDPGNDRADQQRNQPEQVPPPPPEKEQNTEPPADGGNNGDNSGNNHGDNHGDNHAPPPRGEGPDGRPDAREERYQPRFYFSVVKTERPTNAPMPLDLDALADVLQGKPAEYTIVYSEGEDLRVYTHSGYSRDDRKGAVQVAYPLKDVYRAISGLDMALLLLVPVGLIGAWGMGMALTTRVLRPVHHMTQSAARLGAEDLARRLPVSGNDEFSELAGTFNGLLGRLDRAFQQQRQMLQLQQRFTADASHELKTPLTIIKGRASMAAARATTDEKSRHAFREIDEAANTMSRLVQDLLLLARSDEGQMGRNRMQMLVRELVGTAVNRSAREEGATIQVDIAPADLTLSGNEEELVRLLRNLLDNAIHYTPAEGTIRVTARPISDPIISGDYAGILFAGTTDRQNGVVLTVADTGQGIAPEHLPHLGERFYRVDGSRTRPTGGTGLGLSICRGIVSAHNGTLHFQSRQGVGTTVTILLPADSAR